MPTPPDNATNRPRVNVTVRILSRDYTVACDPQERQSVIDAAELLDKRMRAISRGGRVLGVERCAIMAALHLSHELLSVSDAANSVGENQARLRELQGKVDRAVVNARQGDLVR